MAQDFSNSNDALRPDSNLYLLNSFRKLKGTKRMSMSQSLVPQTKENEELLYKVIIENDVSKLSPMEKVNYVKNLCLSLGLNPLTKPIQFIKFQGKEIPYFTKDSTEQLRKNNNISLSIKNTQLLDDIYVVVVEARTTDGRSDTATGAVSLAGLKGADKANAFMKAETKAKRRATLSICGLGMLDESELDGLPLDKPDYIKPVVNNVQQITNNPEPVEYDQDAFIAALADMDNCKDKNELRSVFTKAYKNPAIVCDAKSKNELIRIKDLKLADLSKPAPDYVDIDATTGEVLEAAQ